MKKFISLMLALVMAFSISVSVLADDAAPTYQPETMSTEDNIQPYGFSRNYRQYYELNSRVMVMQDVNWDINNDTFVNVNFAETSGPTLFKVEIWYKEDNATTWTMGRTQNIRQNSSVSCTIPADYTFCVVPTAIGGYNGYVTFQVSLS